VNRSAVASCWTTPAAARTITPTIAAVVPVTADCAFDSDNVAFPPAVIAVPLGDDVPIVVQHP
jgi:hypothetical protein